jgi:hypothetical protein
VASCETASNKFSSIIDGAGESAIGSADSSAIVQNRSLAQFLVPRGGINLSSIHMRLR